MVASWTARDGGGGIAVAVGEGAGGCHGSARHSQRVVGHQGNAHTPLRPVPQRRGREDRGTGRGTPTRRAGRGTFPRVALTKKNQASTTPVNYHLEEINRERGRKGR